MKEVPLKVEDSQEKDEVDAKYVNSCLCDFLLLADGNEWFNNKFSKYDSSPEHF